MGAYSEFCNIKGQVAHEHFMEILSKLFFVLNNICCCLQM